MVMALFVFQKDTQVQEVENQSFEDQVLHQCRTLDFKRRFLHLKHFLDSTHGQEKMKVS